MDGYSHLLQVLKGKDPPPCWAMGILKTDKLRPGVVLTSVAPLDLMLKFIKTDGPIWHILQYLWMDSSHLFQNKMADEAVSSRWEQMPCADEIVKCAWWYLYVMRDQVHSFIADGQKMKFCVQSYIHTLLYDLSGLITLWVTHTVDADKKVNWVVKKPSGVLGNL